MSRISGTAVTRAAIVLAGLGVAVAPACAQDTTARVRPPMISLAGATSPADSVQRVLARFRADTGFETAPGLSDDQRLMVGSCPRDCRYGPRARIQAHRDAYHPVAAAGDSVLIIGRIINEDNIAYGKFNLHARDTVYWGVTTLGNRRVSVFYSSREGARPFYSDLVVENHYAPMYRQATARWYWNDRDEAAWGTCDGGRCCRSSGVALAR